MKTNEALREIVASRGYTQTALAAELGISQPSVAKMLSGRGNKAGVDTLNAYFRVLGYRIAFVPVGTKLPEGCYAIDADAE